MSWYHCRDASGAYFLALCLQDATVTTLTLPRCHCLPGGVRGLHGHGLPNSQASTPDNLDSHKHENIYERPITADATCFSQTVRDKQLWLLDLYLGFFSLTLFFFTRRLKRRRILADAQKRKAFMTVRTITMRENFISDMDQRFGVQLCCGHLARQMDHFLDP